MKKIKWIGLLWIVFSCSSSDEISENTQSSGNTNNSIEVSDSTSVELEESDRPVFESDLINQFINVANKFSHYNYCYDEEGVINLFEGNMVDNYGWVNLDIYEEFRHLSINNQECHTDVTFKMFEKGEQTYAFFSQMSKSEDEFQLLKLDGGEENWIDVSEELPEVKYTDFFSNLTPLDEETVLEFGCYFTYVEKERVVLLFGDWAMGQELQYIESDAGWFRQESDIELVLKWDETKFWIEKVEEYPISKTYIDTSI